MALAKDPFSVIIGGVGGQSIVRSSEAPDQMPCAEGVASPSAKGTEFPSGEVP